MSKLKLFYILIFCVAWHNGLGQTDTTYHYIYNCDSCGVFETFSSAPLDIETTVNVTTQVLQDSSTSTLAIFTNSNARRASNKNENILAKNIFNVYPNPASRAFYLNFKSNKACAASMQLFNIYGVELLRKEIQLNKGTNVIEEETKNLATGYYFIKVNFNNDTFTKKIAFKNATR